MPYRIEKIVVEGFRGFRKKKELEFKEGLVILYGPQRSGKSSVVNAIAWALIGAEATKVKLGPIEIRERARWLAENRDARSRCMVEIVLREAGGATLAIERRSARDECTVRRNDRQVSESPLAALRLTVEGLVSSVFLPQEAVRAPVSVEPANRQKIFTQLAGLGDFEDLEKSFKDGLKILNDAADRIARYRENIDTAVKTQVSTQRDRINELSANMSTRGLSAADISSHGVKALVKQSVAALTEFCKQYQMEVPTLPDVGGPEDLPGFVEEARSALSRFEAKSPETNRQSELYRRKHAIERLDTERQEIEEKRQEINKARQAIAEAHGTQEELERAIEESDKALEEINEQIDQAGKYLKMVEEALTYFGTFPEAAEIECPLCRKARVTVAHVRDHLASQIQAAGLQPLHRRKNAITQTLQQKRDAQSQLLLLAQQDKEVEAKWGTLVQNVGELRGQALGPHESLELVLHQIRQAVDSELNSLQGLLEARGNAINKVRQELEKLGVVRELHRETQRLARLDNIPNLPEYRAVLETEIEAERWVGLLSELQRAMKEEVDQTFREKFAAVKDKVNEFYRRLVGREDFPEIWIHAENWEVLAGAGGQGIGVTKVFNVGDMTAVALSLFLASATRASHDAGFILLDDPSQNLDEEHERRLAEILTEVAQRRQVLVATGRASFLEALKTAGTVKRQVIRFAAWDSDRSCRLEGEATAR